MEPPSTCQSCRRAASEGSLSYRKGRETIHHATFLQCDVCERYACANCLEVYDIFSGYDFLCHECARSFPPSGGERGH